MNWDEWTGYLEELVGHELGSHSVYLLVPRSGEADLSDVDAVALSDNIHQRLFVRTRSAADELSRLATRNARDSLPLLYFSAWLARQQEANLMFWPPFNRAVVRHALADQTVQQRLAPLITDLWWKMHREWGIYRPQEGRVHVKWPQAHAGLPEGERDFLSEVVIRALGWSDEPPDLLYAEPDDFLSALRIWFQSGQRPSRRLERLTFGADGPALVLAELVQQYLLAAWPPPRVSGLVGSVAQGSSPYVTVSYEPLRLSVVLPEGAVPGHWMLSADFGAQQVQLATSFSTQPETTHYHAHEWPVRELPWPRDLTLRSRDSNLQLRIRPEFPFGAREPGALMFDMTTNRPVKRWRPNREYYLLLRASEAPAWLSALFVGAQLQDMGSIAGLELQAVSAIGRDLTQGLSRTEVSDLLRTMEGELQAYGAQVSLPDPVTLFRPQLQLCDGILLLDGKYPNYARSHPPAILAKNLHHGEVNVSVSLRNDDGSETIVADASLEGESSAQDVLLRLPECAMGTYVLRGASDPQYFNLVEDDNEKLAVMDVSLRLRKGEGILAVDDVRHLETAGMELRAWPFARISMVITTEEGTYSLPAALDATGSRIVRGGELRMPEEARWLRIRAQSWLARSDEIDVALRPFVPVDGWLLDDNYFMAQVRGAVPGDSCDVWQVPRAPWAERIHHTTCLVDDALAVTAMLPASPLSGWLVVASSPEVPWLVAQLDPDVPAYDAEDVRVARDSDPCLPTAVVAASGANDGLSLLVAVVEIARTAREVQIPAAKDVPEHIQRRAAGIRPGGDMRVRLPGAWGSAFASLRWRNQATGEATLRLGDRTYGLHVVDNDGGIIAATWEGPSGPCHCEGCHQIMTQAEWYAHRSSCGVGLTVLPRGFSLTSSLDWPTYMDSVEAVFLKAIARKSDDVSGDLEETWSAVQRSFRERPGQDGLSPTDWVLGGASGWRLLYRIIEQPTREDVDWVDLWSSIAPFEPAIRALAISTR